MRNTDKLNRLVLWMKARNDASSTIANYSHHLEVFFRWADEDSCRISEKKIQDYILQVPDSFSFSYKNQAINAIKLYFKVIENRVFNDVTLPRPKDQQYIPNVLTEEQTERVIFNTKNLKHRAALFTIYDNGLRISEFLNLTLMDLRTKCDNPHLIIQKAKHHSSRTIEVSERFLELIRKYYKAYHPKKYLFEGDNGEKYSKTSVRNILNAALKREGIKYHIRVHDLRHTFSTHLLANETDIHHLSNALGHKSVKTTEKHYAHLRFDQIKLRRPQTSNPKPYKLSIAI
jgi:site-specific recombinase XerD